MQHPFHIFECLRALNSIIFSPVRDFANYEKSSYLNDISFETYGKLLPKEECPFWFELKRPDFSSFPILPPQLFEWIGDWGGQTPGKPPHVKKYSRGSQELWNGDKVDLSLTTPAMTGFIGERFDADEKRVALWLNWLNGEWYPWARANLEKSKVLALYDEFIEIYDAMQRGDSQFELIWANAVLLWRSGSTEIRHPLLTQKMEMDYDPEKGIFRLAAKSTPTRFEYDMLFDLGGFDINTIFTLEQRLFENMFDLRDQAALKDFCARFAEILSSDAALSDERIKRNAKVTSQPCIYFNEPLLLLRRVDSRKWRGELEGVVEVIDNGDRSINLPDVFGDYYRRMSKKEDHSDRTWKENASDPLFPWSGAPYHKEILKSIANKPLTVAQTPPRSDKERLIANILVHFLAHGKKVLVTGSSNSVLKNITNLLHQDFEEITPLCISTAGNDQENTKELLASLRAHSQKINYYSKEEIARELAVLQKKFGTLRKEVAEEKRHLQAVREFEFSRRFNVKGTDMPPWQIAKWLDENKSKLGFIKDEIKYDAEFPLHPQQVQRFSELLSKVSLQEGKALNQWFPDSILLMEGERLEHMLEELTELLAGRPEREDMLSDCMIIENLGFEDIKELAMQYQEAMTDLPCHEGDWTNEMLKDILASSHRLKSWQDLQSVLGSSVQKLQGLHSILKDHEIVLPEGYDFRQIREALYSIRAELFKNNKIGMFYKISAAKNVFKIQADCFVNGFIPNTVKDIDLILSKVDYLDEARRVAARWNLSMQDIGGPELDNFMSGFPVTLEHYMLQVKKALEWRTKHFARLVESWQSFATRAYPNWSSRMWLMGMCARVQAWGKQRLFEELSEKLNEQYRIVLQKPEEASANPVCFKLREALDNKDVKLWKECAEEVAAFEKRRVLWHELNELYQTLASKAPLWAQDIASDERPQIPLNYKEAWQYARTNSWLKKHLKSTRLSELTQSCKNRQQEEAELLQEMAGVSAWYWQLNRLSTEEKQALEFLLYKNQENNNNLDNINDGKSASFLREADFWRFSVPAWIMPVDSLLETSGSFDINFDVVIISDSEKMDVFNSCLMLRGKRTLVLGDDMLLGLPQSAHDRAAANLLLEKSLSGLTTRIKFDLYDSLYSFARRLCGGYEIILDETGKHPAFLNSFINKYAYGGQLHLLEQADDNRYVFKDFAKIALPVKKVNGNVNEDEAEQIVNKLSELVKKPKYKNKTFGIFTLGNIEQEQLLREKIFLQFDEVMIKERGIVCSVAEGYTGSQKDVVLLSSVSAKTAGTADIRTLNTIMGLAKEKCIAYHAFLAGDLPEDSAFAELLVYQYDKEDETGKNKRKVPVLPEVISDVYTELEKNGYPAIKEYLSGQGMQKLEIAVSDGNNKAAVILDGLRGRAELESISLLEDGLKRQGWYFYHLSAAEFYTDKEKTMELLQEFLDDINIRKTFKKGGADFEKI